MPARATTNVAMSAQSDIVSPLEQPATLASPWSPKSVDHRSSGRTTLLLPHSGSAGDSKEQLHPRLTFFQNYFTLPASASDDLEELDPDERHFAWRATGSVTVVVTLLLLVICIVVAAVATVVEHRHNIQDQQYRGSPVRMVITSNFPDPSLLYDNGTWYAFGTNNAAGVLQYHADWRVSNPSENTPNFGKANVQMAVSNDFVNWTLISLEHQPLPTIGQWSQDLIDGNWVQPGISNTWAPAVIRRDDGKYVMYYASGKGGNNPYTKANDFDSSHPTPHCIGAAVSNGTSPAGPYTALNTDLVCPWQQGGAIDPEVIRDVDGTLYLVYKVDGNNIGHGGSCGNTESPIMPTPIMLQRLAPNGIQVVGPPREILTNNNTDGPLVEAPMLIRSQEGIYFLFFSAGCTRALSYNTQYATATNITGPYTKPVNSTFLQTNDWGLEAPGSVGIAADGEGGWNLAFQARSNHGDVGRVRAMFTAKLNLTGHTASIVGAEEGSIQLDRKG